jgi:hypothetical protein
MCGILKHPVRREKSGHFEKAGNGTSYIQSKRGHPRRDIVSDEVHVQMDWKRGKLDPGHAGMAFLRISYDNQALPVQ